MGEEGAGVAQNFVTVLESFQGFSVFLKQDLSSCQSKVLHKEVVPLPPCTVRGNILKLKDPSLELLMCMFRFVLFST